MTLLKLRNTFWTSWLIHDNTDSRQLPIELPILKQKLKNEGEIFSLIALRFFKCINKNDFNADVDVLVS